MAKRFFLLAALGLLGAMLASAPAAAQAARTWVSGVGDDANPCSRTSACKTFAGAISKTAVGGEIDCLDPGGFGAVTITKAITIDCSATHGSVLTAGTNGITVSAGASDVVILRGLSLIDVGTTTLNGIQYNSGAQLSVENCFISGFAADINANVAGTSELYVTNTYLTKATNGVSLAETTAGQELFVFLNNVSIFNMGSIGLGTSGTGNMDVSMTNSAIASSGTAINAGTVNARVYVDRSTIHTNNVGFNANANGVLLRISNNNIYENQTNFTIAVGATIASAHNNQVSTDSTAPNGTVTLQ